MRATPASARMAPKTIQGARRPQRDLVRSEVTPMMGCMIIVAATASEAASDKLDALADS
jgi:hypothetical protein